MKTKALSRSQPRDVVLNEAWYYVNDGSVDLVVREPDQFTKIVRLKRKMLQQMLSELKPLKR